MHLINENETVHQLISCHWSLYVPPENSRKQFKWVELFEMNVWNGYRNKMLFSFFSGFATMEKYT